MLKVVAMHRIVLGQDEKGMPVFSPYRPWPEERKHRASIAAKKRLALKKKERLEAELKSVKALLKSLK